MNKIDYLKDRFKDGLCAIPRLLLADWNRQERSDHWNLQRSLQLAVVDKVKYSGQLVLSVVGSTTNKISPCQ